MVIAVGILVLVLAGRGQSKINFENCKNYKTYGYAYLTFLPVEILETNSESNPTLIMNLEFYVKAANNAHILLTEIDYRSVDFGYEILLGGGNNTFSQLRIFRSLRMKSTKHSRMTKDILSANEYRGFWIKVDVTGMIRVGRVGEENHFLSYIDRNAASRVKFFALSTWSNILGDWYFHCDKSLEANVPAIKSLKMDLFTFYNPTNFPRSNGEVDQVLNLHMEAEYFRLDEVAGKLMLYGLLHLHWIDWSLRWNSSVYGGIDALHLTPLAVATPNLRIMNSFGFSKRSFLPMTGSVVVQSNGSAYWRVPFQSVTSCSFGYTNWPLDIHNCSLLLGFDTESVEISLKNFDFSKMHKSEWVILKVAEESDETDNHKTGIQIQFRRQDLNLESLLLPPYLGAVTLSLISFWIRSDSLSKIFLNCGSVFLLILLLLDLRSRIPAVASSIPKIVSMYSWITLAFCVPILFFILMKYSPITTALPGWFSAVLNSRVTEVLFCLPAVRTNNSPLAFIHSARLTALMERIVFLIYMTALILPYITYYEIFDKMCTETRDIQNRTQR